MRKLFRALLVALAVVVVAVAGGSLYLLSYSLRPERTIRAKNAASYEYMYAEYPFLRPWVDSLERAGALHDTVIRRADGVRLHALYAAAPHPTDRTAVIVHGYTDNAVRMLMIGYLYNHDLGYNILLPDLCYHGRSEGCAIQMGWKDRLDVLRWTEIADSLFGGHTRQVVHGISMGAATTMMLSGEELPSCVKCFVEDCGYTSVRDQFAKELRGQFGLPAFPLLDVASWLCGLKYGWTFGEASSLKQVARCDRPMFFIHGDADDYVPTAMVYPLYEAKPGERSCGWCRGRRMPSRTATTARSTRGASVSLSGGISRRSGIRVAKDGQARRTTAEHGVLPDAGGGDRAPAGRGAGLALPAVCRGVCSRRRTGRDAPAVRGVRP